jgi:hypothetical protein
VRQKYEGRLRKYFTHPAMETVVAVTGTGGETEDVAI